MKYAEVRVRIRTGDLIALRQRGGVVATLTRLITRSPYTHTAVAVWSGNRGRHRLLVAEASPSGGVLVPLSQYADVDFDVFVAPHSVQPRIENDIWAALGVPLSYGFSALYRIAAHRLLGWPLPAAGDDHLICSALSARLWLSAGWHPKFPMRLPSIPAPDDIVAAVGMPPAWEVRKEDDRYY